jgi:hypothetical protein
MLNILQIEDRLKDMSEDVIKRMVTQPNSSVPPFLATNELNRRDRMRKEFQMRQAQDVPTVAEQLVTGAGMPNEAMSQMAMNMAPKSDISGNTGLEAMMPKETMPETEEDEVMMMEDEEPLGMNFGGLINSRLASISRMAAPMAREVTSMPQRMDYGRMMQSAEPMGMSRGLSGFGSDIMNRVSDKSRGDVDNFLGEVEGMAEDRFDIDLAPQQRQIGMSGKGQSLRRPMPAMNSMPAIPFAMKEGGQVRGAMVGGLQNLLNPDGTIKEEFEDSAMTADGTVVTGGSPYETDEDRTQMSPTSDKNDDNDPPPPPKTTAGPSSFDNILSMIQEDRESAKEQRDRDKYLALMQFGLNLAKRGQLEDTGEGLKTLAMSNKAYQDQLAKLRGLDVNALLTQETIAGRERAAGITAEAALARALAKGGLDEKELASIVSSLRSDVADYRKQLSDTDSYNLNPADRAVIQADLQAALKELYRYQGILEGQRTSQDVTTDIYPEDGK